MNNSAAAKTIEECQRTIEKLGASHIGTILDYSVEGKSEEEDFEATKDEIIRTIKRASDDEKIPFAVFKISGIAPYGTLEKISAGIETDRKRKMENGNAFRAASEDICGYAHSLDQPVFIDAEETWLQNAIDLLAEQMMAKYNTEKAIVFTTIQLYRADGLSYLKRAHEKAQEKGYIFAVKLVRGAYMEKERERADEMGLSIADSA